MNEIGQLECVEAFIRPRGEMRKQRFQLVFEFRFPRLTSKLP
jgi:hypothetical protein